MKVFYHPESESAYATPEPGFWDFWDGFECDPFTLPAGTEICVGPGVSTVLPDFDFETYSEAGHVWDPEAQKWRPPRGATKKGLTAVGAAVYAEHPTTEVLSLAYNLKDGRGPRRWLPGMPPPADLFEHIARGGLLEAHNSMFEYRIWQAVCVPRMGWPDLPLEQLRCSMAKARAHALPGKLANLSDVLDLPHGKDKDGKRLLDKFSVPRNPTKNNPALRIRPQDDPVDAEKLYQYNDVDIVAESEASARIPDLPPEELAYWQADQRINYRGVGLDVKAVEDCIAILEQAYDKYNPELCRITGGAVEKASEVAKLIEWLGAQGVYTQSLEAEQLETLLARPDLTPAVRRALQIRNLIGSAGVKKLYAMARQVNRAGRLCDLFIYHGARTGRDTGADVQPQNLVKAGVPLRWCGDMTCQQPYGQHLTHCPHCGADAAFSEKSGWTYRATDQVLAAMATRSLEYVEYMFGDAVLAISGCIRGLFIAADGHELLCSDYSSIEAVVTACLAGEQWRIEAFKRREDIYLHGAAGVTGKTYEEYRAYAEQHGKKHPDRQLIGKPAELGLGFGGWVGAWRQFDKTDNFSDDDVKKLINKWRAASPMIVEFWGGQVRGKPWAPDRSELYGLEGAAIAAVQTPGTAYGYRLITYQVKDDVLYCRLPSGRLLTYHQPRLEPSDRWPGQLGLSYMGWNSNPAMGSLGWVRIKTYGGRLCENVVQATARDVMRDAVVNLEAAGYPIVLRVHDELAAEVPAGSGSVEEFEAIMGRLPAWCADWPIRAAGGYRAKRYRKDD